MKVEQVEAASPHLSVLLAAVAQCSTQRSVSWMQMLSSSPWLYAYGRRAVTFDT